MKSSNWSKVSEIALIFYCEVEYKLFLTLSANSIQGTNYLAKN